LGEEKTGPTMVMERIMPLPKVIRENLIKQYFPKEMQLTALEPRALKHCEILFYILIKCTI
jgi:hypothetical protein